MTRETVMSTRVTTMMVVIMKKAITRTYPNKVCIDVVGSNHIWVAFFQNNSTVINCTI